MILTKEQYEIIERQETEFSHALNEGYFRIGNRMMLADYNRIFKEIFKRKSKILDGCSRCVLNDIKQLAKVYFQDKKELEKNKKNLKEQEIQAQNKAMENESVEEDTTIEETTDTPTKPRKQRKKTTKKKTNKK